MNINNPFPDKEVWIYDLETYPNFFMALFYNGKEFVELFDGKSIVEFVNDDNKLLVGYNSINFDDLILKAIANNEVKNANAAFRFAQWIINHDRETERQIFNRYLWANKLWWKSADLSIFFKDDESGRAKSSLKDLAIRMGWPKIQDLPYKFDTNLSNSQMIEVREYCKNDVLITAELWNRLSDRFELRIELEKNYGVDVFESTNAQISESILLNEYSRITKKDKRELRKMSTVRKTIRLSDIIPPISYSDPQLNSVLDDLKQIVIHSDSEGKFDRSAIDRAIHYAGVILDLKSGGIHSKDKAGTFTTTPGRKIIDADVTSFYPSIMINFGIHPGHLTSQWSNILANITKMRIDAKKSGDKIVSDALKIVINSAFGKAGNKYSFMYDAQLLLQVTITGQLFIIKLVEEIHKSGCEILSANTDGVTAYVPTELENAYYEACRKWERESSFNLEYAIYQKYARNDVNNYIAIYDNGKTKKKGAFDQGNLFKKNDGNVISKAIEGYIAAGIGIEDTIRQEKDITQFCYSYKATRNFKTLYAGKEQQKTNRYYRSVDGKPFLRERIDGVTKTTNIGDIAQVSNAEKVTLCNDLPQRIPSNIDYSYYIQKAKEILYRTITQDKAKEISKTGLHPIPKQYKKNPRKSKLNEIKSDWDFGKYHGVGCYTGLTSGIVALDLDRPELLQIQNLLSDSICVWKGEGSRQDVLSGKKRGTILYRCYDETLKNQGSKFCEQHGFEVLYGKPVQLFGVHPSGQEYHYDGELTQIPKELHLWIYDRTKGQRKKKKKKLCENTGDLFFVEDEPETESIGYSLDDNSYGRFEKTILSLIPNFDMVPDLSNKFEYHVRGYCPFSDEHSGKSNISDFDIFIDPSGAIRCGCHHESCKTSRNELQRKLTVAWGGQVEEIRKDDLQKIEVPEPEANDLLGHLMSNDRIVLIESPTGSGKSYNSSIAFLDAIKNEKKIAYVAANKTEVTQFSEYILDMAGCNNLNDICTQILQREDKKQSEDEQGQVIDIGKNTVGVITHHSYLLRKGISHLFYTFLKWIKDNNAIVIIDEIDALIDSSTIQLQKGARYKSRKSRGEKEATYFKVNQCPKFSRNGNCQNCVFAEHQRYEQNDFSIPVIDTKRKLSEEEFENQKPLEWPEMTYSTEVVLQNRILARQIENHSSSIFQRPYDYVIHDDQTLDFGESIRDIIDSSMNPTVYVEYPYRKSTGEMIYNPRDIDRKDEHDIVYPCSPCGVPTMSFRDMSVFAYLKRYAAKVRMLSARVSQNKKDFLNGAFLGVKMVKLTESISKIDELLVVTCDEKLNVVESKKDCSLWFDEIEKIAKTLVFFPKKKIAKDFFKSIVKDKNIGFYEDNYVGTYNERLIGGEWKSLATYSRGPIGRGINLGQFHCNIVDTEIYKPTICYNLKEYTVDEIEKLIEDDRIDIVYQNSGRILRGNEGRKVIVLHQCDRDFGDWLSREIAPMVREEIKRAHFANNPINAKSTAYKWLKFGNVEIHDPSKFEEAIGRNDGRMTKDCFSPKIRKQYGNILEETKKKTKMDNFILLAKEWSGNWSSFNKKYRITKRQLKKGVLSSDDVSYLKTIINNKISGQEIPVKIP